MKKRVLGVIFVIVFALLLAADPTFAQTKKATKVSTTSTPTPLATTASAVIVKVEVTPVPQPNITRETQETVEPLIKLLRDQELGSALPWNPIKYAIRGAVSAGVPANTIVLLLLLPGVAALIAATRHLVGLRGFGIFLPAALSIVFVATGPIIGIGLFLVIVFVSTLARISMRRIKINLQYLPRMALMLLLVVLGILVVLFMAPIIPYRAITNVSIFPVLILVLLAEDFSKVQLGKSAKVAINLTTETLILSFMSYIFLTTKAIQEVALLKPEIWIFTIAIVDVLLGKYVGLRLLEIWRFRRLLQGK